MKKSATLLFVCFPIVLITAMNLSAPYTTNEYVLGWEMGEPYWKHRLFMKRGRIDTVICGDSRVQRIVPGPFLAREWDPFNWALSGLSSFDTAMEVAYSLANADIRRLVIGVSFESMSDMNAFWSSSYVRSFPFTDPRINRLWGQLDDPPEDKSLLKRLGRLRNSIESLEIYTKRRFRARLKYVYYAYIKRQYPPDILDGYGNPVFREIRSQIDSGTFDFEKNRAPLLYFNRADSEAAYLKNKTLSPQVQQIYQWMFQELRARKIPTLVFETGRLPAYQELIDQDPLLKDLYAQWQGFFRGESYGGIKFLEANDTAACYFADDFFDAVHFLGEKTENALSEKLAAELEDLERHLHRHSP